SPVMPRQWILRHEMTRHVHAAAISFHIIGKALIREHRDMAENIVKYIRLLQIIELVRFPDEIAGHETAIGKMVEKHIIGNKTRHSDDFPASRIHQYPVQLVKVRNTGLGKLQNINSVQKCLRRASR